VSDARLDDEARAEVAGDRPRFRGRFDDDETALAALNKGLPLREVKANSPLRRSLVQLAETLITPAPAEGTEVKRKKGLLGGLFAS